MTTRTLQGSRRDPMKWLAKPFNVIVSEKNLNQALRALERVGFHTGKELAKSQLRNYQEVIVEYLAISEQARSKARRGYEVKEEEQEDFLHYGQYLSGLDPLKPELIPPEPSKEDFDKDERLSLIHI